MTNIEILFDFATATTRRIREISQSVRPVTGVSGVSNWIYRTR
jgi:hypothetical protein